MADTRLRSYLNDSKPIDLKKNEGMRVLMAIKGNLDQSKNPNATRFAAAEMAIEKVSVYHSYVLHFAQFLLLNWALVRFSRFLRAAASNFFELMSLTRAIQCASHCRQADRTSDYNECAVRCSDDFKAACECISCTSSYNRVFHSVH